MDVSTLEEITIETDKLQGLMMDAHISACWVAVEAEREGVQATPYGEYLLLSYLSTLRHHLAFIGASADLTTRVSRKFFEEFALPIWSDTKQLTKRL